MKKYGSERTNLVLSKEAFEYYSGTGLLDIWEVETDDGLRYRVRGMVNADEITEEEVNEFLHDLWEESEEAANE